MPDPEEKTLEQELGEQYDAQESAAEEETEDAVEAKASSESETEEETVGASAEETETVAEEETEAQQTSGEEEAGEDPSSTLSAPTHWSADAQRMFLGVPTEAQQFLLDQHKAMEAAHTKRSQEVAPLRKTLETWNPYFQKIGTTPDLMVADLLQFEHSLRSGTPQQKLQAIQEVAKNYGVELTAMNGNGQPEEAEAVGGPICTDDRGAVEAVPRHDRQALWECRHSSAGRPRAAGRCSYEVHSHIQGSQGERRQVDSSLLR